MSTTIAERTISAPHRNPSGLDETSGFTARGDRTARPDIQGLRAVAVLLVVLYHSGVPLISGGFVGVDVFLVISGFLITRSLLTESDSAGRISLSRFYARRIRRLLPSALVVILVTVVVARLWGPALQSTSVARDGVFAALYSINYWLAGQGVDYQHANSAVSPLQHFWSLAVEEQFYLVWPLVLVIVIAITRGGLIRFRRPAIAVVIVAIGLFSFQQSASVTATNAPLAYFSLQTRGWELAVGALIAIAVPLLRRAPEMIAAVASWIGLGMILYSAIVFTDSTPFPGTLAGIPVAGAGLIIAAGLLERRGSVEKILRPRPVKFLGSVSYGWYLWHWPAIVLGPYLFAEAFGWPEKLELSVVALWFAVITYLTLERFSRRKSISRRRWFAIGGGMTASVVSIALLFSVIAPPAAADAAGPPTASLASVAARGQLEATIAASVALRRLPQNIQPTIASAGDDVPITSHDGCHVSFLATSNKACVFGDTGASRTIVLFGDSHAEQWFGAVNALAMKDHWRLVSWTKAACQLSDVTLVNPQLKRAYRECDTWRAQTIKDIAALHPQLVLVSQANTLAGPDVSGSRWASGTASTLAQLTGTGDSVVMLADTPHPDQDVPSCLDSHTTTVSSCNVVAESLAAGGYLEVRRSLVAKAARELGVPLIDPTTWFCSGRICPPVIANAIVYRDDSHMTQTYSTALELPLGRALARYLG